MKWKKDWGLTSRVILTWALLLLVYLIFLSVLNVLIPNMFGTLLAFVIVFGFIQYFFSSKLVLMSTRARVVSADEYPDLHAMIGKLAREADLPMPKVAVMASPVPNAFATGRNPKNAVVAVTDSIMRTLDRDELEAVIAHELSHVKNRDVLTMTVASFVAMLASLIMQNALFASLFDRNSNGAWIVAWIVSIVVWLVATILMMSLSRYREFAADRGSAYITKNPAALKNALIKISGRMDRVPVQEKQKVEGANMFYIIPALSGKSLTELFSTHPPLEKRIAALEAIEAEMRGA